MARERALEMIVEFAKKSKKISEIYEGNDPEEESSKVFYLLYPGKFSPEFQDKMTSLDVEVYQKTGYLCSIVRWPISPKEAGDYPFLGKRIWKKLKSRK